MLARPARRRRVRQPDRERRLRELQPGVWRRQLGLVAQISDAQHYTAESADELLEVFSTIPLETEKKKVRMELSAVLTAASALLALAAVALGQRWTPLPCGRAGVQGVAGKVLTQPPRFMETQQFLLLNEYA